MAKHSSCTDLGSHGPHQIRVGGLVGYCDGDPPPTPAGIDKAAFEEFIVRVEQVAHAAAEARRTADEAARRAREARDAAGRAEQAAESIAKDMGAVWRTMNGES